MTTSVLDRVPVDVITERARQVKPGAFALRLVLGVFILIGWVAAKLFAGFWACFTFAWAAVETGWARANGPSRGQQIAMLTARVEALSADNRRLGGSG